MPTIQEIATWRHLLSGDTLPSGTDLSTDAERIDQISELERLKSLICATQATLAVDLDTSTRAREADAGIPAARRGRGVAAQVALARHESPHRGQVLLGLARDLTRDLPHTMDALADGDLSEYAAMVVARETGCLESEDRARVDAEVCGDRDLLTGLGIRGLVGEISRRAYAADPASVVRRRSRAESERRVTARPAPDTMAYLTALLPVAQAIAAQVALTRDADTLRSAGDERTKGQLMADLLVQRLTGQADATAVPVTVDLVISDASLLGSGHEPATIPGWGPVSAQVARELIAKSLDECPTWLRRLYSDPTGQLVALTSRQRFAPDGLTDLLTVRDQGLCRTPWCDAPARHVDHVTPAADGGPTTADNTQTLCEACNHAKQTPGWQQQVIQDKRRRHTVETTTPTGHRHRSRAPAPPRPATPPRRTSRLEISFAQSRLRPILGSSDPGATVTAGNASGQNDAAAMCVVTTPERAEQLGLRPLVRLVSWSVAGVGPSVMGIGPVPATAAALGRAGLELADIDVIELNEAFAAQALAVMRAWEFTDADHERTNVHGSGISLGHPVGATGVRMLGSLARELGRRKGRYGLETMCIGGGQGMAAVFERVS